MTHDGHSKERVSFVDEFIHMIHPPHGVPHLFHGFLYLVRLFLQVWYPSSDGAFGLISSFSVILRLFIF